MKLGKQWGSRKCLDSQEKFKKQNPHSRRQQRTDRQADRHQLGTHENGGVLNTLYKMEKKELLKWLKEANLCL